MQAVTSAVAAVEAAASTQLARATLMTLTNATAVAAMARPRVAAMAQARVGDSDGGDAGGDDDDDDDDKCAGLSGVYSVGLHVGAVFVILVASLLGTIIPIVGKRVRVLRLHPYVYAVGKCTATGVMLAVAMIHMINEAAQTFDASCVPAQFSKQYEAWAFALAMASAVMMHALDLCIVAIAQRWAAQRRRQQQQQQCDDDTRRCVDKRCCPDHTTAADDAQPPHHACELRLSPHSASATTTTTPTPTTAHATDAAPHSCACDVYAGNDDAAAAVATKKDSSDATTTTTTTAVAATTTTSASAAAATTAGDECGHCEDTGVAHMCVSHQHTFVMPDDVPVVQRVVAAVCMEIGVTLHSVFVGLTLGVTEDNQVKALLVALVFHQLFEGLAMGSRLADAEFKASLEVLLTLVFSFSAPIGIAVGTAAVTASATALSGATYVMVTGVFDALCGGILLYLAFTLMLIDFPADLRRHCGDGAPYATCKKLGLFAGLWVGAAVMALIGKWL